MRQAQLTDNRRYPEKITNRPNHLKPVIAYTKDIFSPEGAKLIRTTHHTLHPREQDNE